MVWADDTILAAVSEAAAASICSDLEREVADFGGLFNDKAALLPVGAVPGHCTEQSAGGEGGHTVATHIKIADKCIRIVDELPVLGTLIVDPLKPRPAGQSRNSQHVVARIAAATRCFYAEGHRYRGSTASVRRRLHHASSSVGQVLTWGCASLTVRQAETNALDSCFVMLMAKIIPFGTEEKDPSCQAPSNTSPISGKRETYC